MKKTKIFIGLAALIAIVSMNMRHAWMNYGIAEKRILADEVVAPTDTATSSDDEPRPSAVYHNYETKRRTHYTLCVVRVVFEYYKKVNGVDKKVAIKTLDFLENSEILKPVNADTIGATVVKVGEETEKFTSEETYCDGRQDRNTCIPKDALSNCEDFITRSL